LPKSKKNLFTEEHLCPLIRHSGANSKKKKVWGAKKKKKIVTIGEEHAIFGKGPREKIHRGKNMIIGREKQRVKKKGVLKRGPLP